MTTQGKGEEERVRAAAREAARARRRDVRGRLILARAGALSESFRRASGRLAAQAEPKVPLGAESARAREAPAEERMIIWSSEKGSMVDA